MSSAEEVHTGTFEAAVAARRGGRLRLTHALRSTVWLIPLLCVLGGVALSIATIGIDRHTIMNSFRAG
jgi:hypothetical protein